jgi:hypothetical protein
VDQEEKEYLSPLPASLTAVPNTLRYQIPFVFSSLTSFSVTLQALEFAHFFPVF